MQQIEKNLEKSISSRRSVFLFTGNKKSTLLMSIFKDMNIDIVFIDTGCQFIEILDYVNSFGDRIDVIQNSNALIDHASELNKCCCQRKIEPLKKYLHRINAESLVVPFSDEERNNGIEDSYLNGIKNIEIIKPLAELSERDVWIEIKKKKLPFSRIYNKGYRIVDCKCCVTRHGRRTQKKIDKPEGFDDETIEKLKALGYM